MITYVFIIKFDIFIIGVALFFVYNLGPWPSGCNSEVAIELYSLR